MQKFFFLFCPLVHTYPMKSQLFENALQSRNFENSVLVMDRCGHLKKLNFSNNDDVVVL